MLSTTALHSQTLDTAFTAHATDVVRLVGLQPDGDVLALGDYFLMNDAPRDQFSRLNLDGSLDSIFNPCTFGIGGSFAVQPDGKIIIAGSFTDLAGRACTNIGRLNANGTLDFTFSASSDRTILTTLLQPDGRLLVSGVFTNLDGQPCTRLGRLNSDGGLDTNFNASANSVVRSFALQPDGKILVGGNFTNLDGEAVNFIGRLNTNGSIDHSFNSSADNSVLQILVQSNNLIVVCGGFTNLAGVPRARIGRLNTDGSIDSSFNPGASNAIMTMALQANGKIIVGGSFTNLAGVTRNHIGRLNSNGSLDLTFNPGADANVYSLALQADGKIVVGGMFTNLAGGVRNFIARLLNNDTATQSLSFNASSITWLRSGSASEIAGARFEFSTNGADWFYLGNGTRVTGGWQASGLSIPAQASVRALGSVATSGVSGVSGTGCSFFQQIAGLPVIISQPAGAETVPGSNVVFTATADGTPALAYQWQFNGTNLINGPKISGATNASLVLSNVTTTNIGNYALIISNSFGAVTSRIASLKMVAPITNDFGAGYIGTFYTVASQADGRKIFGGSLSTVGGFFGLERANYNGTLDPSFLVRGTTVYCIVVQPDGDIVAGGSFSASGSVPVLNIERVHADGTLDASFTNKPSAQVNALALQPDGKIILGGLFGLIGNQSHSRIGRLNADGTLDTNFNAAVDNVVSTVALQNDGKILIGGSFTNVNGVPIQNLARLNSDGSLDSTFLAFFNNPVTSVAVQPDGKILAGGSWFTVVDGEFWDNYVVRLNPDGSLDTTFNAFPNSILNSIVLQSDDKVLLGGSFNALNGQTNSHLNFGRVKSDGTTDFTFIGGASSTVDSLAIQFDGGILLTGFFGLLYDSSPTSHSANASGHFKNTEPVSNLISYNGSTVTWTRTGPAPECSWVQFEASPDGTNWSALGLGIYTNNAWQINGVSVPASSVIRARGYVAGGYHNGSGWIVEARSGAPFFLMNPVGVTNVFNSTLDGWATGTPPIAYQWIKDGVVVTNYPSGQLTGAQTSSLFLKTAGAGELGHYQLVANNAFGSVTSSVAIVSPSYPWLDSQPLTVTTNAGATVSFPVTVIGAAPLTYQWFNGTLPLTNNTNISGATNGTLTLSNITVADSGSYWLVATNAAGSISNLMATLTVTASSPAPVIVNGSSSFDRTLNGFAFDLTANVGQTIIIETSTNLIDWQPILTNEIDSNPLHFHDPSAITNRNGFYRLRLQ